MEKVVNKKINKKYRNTEILKIRKVTRIFVCLGFAPPGDIMTRSRILRNRYTMPNHHLSKSINHIFTQNPKVLK